MTSKEITQSTIEGTATISIAQLDFFRQQVEQVKELKERMKETQEAMKKLVAYLDDTEYKQQIEAIDKMKNLSDREMRKMCREAAAKLRVFVSVSELRKLVKRYIDRDESDGHYDIAMMTKEEFDGIPILLEEKV